MSTPSPCGSCFLSVTHFCLKFSMRLQSGDSGGVCHHMIPVDSKKDCVFRDVCFGSLSCMNLWVDGKLQLIKVTNSYIEWSIILPSNMHTFVAPCLLMPAQTWTFTGCSGLGFSLGGWFALRKQCLWWNSSWTDVSSFQMTSNLSRHFRHRFSLFAARISWQYHVPWKVQPKSCLLLLIN